MSAVRDVPCSCCSRPVRLMPLSTVYGVVDIHEGLCRSCLALVGADRRALLRQVRLELRFHADRYALFLLIWRSVKSQAIERRDGKRRLWHRGVLAA